MTPTLWHHCHVATMVGGQYHVISDAAILTQNKRIQWVGPRNEAPSDAAMLRHDLGGAWVTPGWIDCHTHAIFGGNRSNEFAQRLQGLSYAQISAQGGGIRSTVASTRHATPDHLYHSARQRLLALMQDGVTTIEIKSGYGLDVQSERKMLQVGRQLARDLPLSIQNTCLAAHALPPDFQGDADDYIDLICQTILPQLAADGLVDAVDAFCENIAFSTEQVRRVFTCAQQLKLPVKIHAEQLSDSQGAQLAATFSALSADHLEYLSEAGVRSMAKAGTVAVLLPGAFHMLKETRLPPVALLRQHGVPMAISTDLNPGTSPALSLRLMLNFACVLFGLTPEEALAGVTCHAAKALGLLHSHGTLEAGKVADFVAWQVEQLSDLSYWLGGTIPNTVIRHGTVRLIPSP
jgi:imidazolonepropionase